MTAVTEEYASQRFLAWLRGSSVARASMTLLPWAGGAVFASSQLALWRTWRPTLLTDARWLYLVVGAAWVAWLDALLTGILRRALRPASDGVTEREIVVGLLLLLEGAGAALGTSVFLAAMYVVVGQYTALDELLGGIVVAGDLHATMFFSSLPTIAAGTLIAALPFVALGLVCVARSGWRFGREGLRAGRTVWELSRLAWARVWRPRGTPPGAKPWNPAAPETLVAHVHPASPLVTDEITRVGRQLGFSFGETRDRVASLSIARALFDSIKRHGLAYEWEPQSSDPAVQLIRDPATIEACRVATCIDAACLFASLLEASFQNPLVVIVELGRSAHALVGYRARDERAWHGRTGLGDLRRVTELEDAVLFEATGALEADRPVGVEPAGSRRDGMLDFADARAAAVEILRRDDTRLRSFIDVRAIRERPVNGPTKEIGP
jgi:hypothetical protein